MGYLLLTYTSEPSMDFHAWWLKGRGLTQRCAFWGFRWYCSPFWGVISPKTPNFGNRIGVFKPNGQNIECFILSKLLQFQPNFAQRQRPPSRHHGCPNTCPTNPRWWTSAILKKNVKLPYLCNCLTDFDEIWHNDAHLPLPADQTLQFWIFESPRCRQPPS